MSTTLFGGITMPGRPDLSNIRKLDLLPIPAIRRAQRLGFAIDITYFHELSSQLAEEMAQLKLDISSEVPPAYLEKFVSDSMDIEEGYVNPNSGDQLCNLLFETLHIGSGKQLKTTKTGTRLSTGKKQLETLKREHPIIQLVLDYRERAKLKSTYTDTLPKIAILHPRGPCCPVCELPHSVNTYRIHTEFTTTRTDTGRLASKNPNLTNIPARTAWGRRVREGFIATPGKVLVGRDLAQIELRLLAHGSRDRNMTVIFQRGEDIHLKTAMEAFQIAADAVDKLLHRAPCKNVNFGIVYGLTETGLYDQMAVTYATAGKDMPDWLTVEWCAAFIKKWFGLYPGVEPYMQTQHYRARRYGFVWDLAGRIRLVPEVRSVHSWIRNAGLRQAGNHPIQSLAAAVFKIAMGHIEYFSRQWCDAGKWVWPLAFIHDEDIIETDPEDADEVADMMDYCMCATGDGWCRVPIKSDGKTMERWIKE